MNTGLTPVELIYAYSSGFFPMAHEEDDNAIYWHRPAMRGIIPLDQFHVSKNLARLYRKNPYSFRINTDFDSVIRACANREETWISDEIISAYNALHRLGYASSYEVWENETLVGGLYGVHIGKAFFGESMFSRKSNTSKLALIFLVQQLLKNDYQLLDTQYLNDHLKQFGAIEIPDETYMELLADATLEES